MPQLTINESAGTLINYVAKLSFTDLQAIGNGGQKNLFKLPAGSGVLSCVVWEKTAIVGSTSLVIDVGTTLGDPDEFIDALDVDAMTAPVANTGDAVCSVCRNDNHRGWSFAGQDGYYGHPGCYRGERCGYCFHYRW
jgi:hypothetical protein